MPQPFLVITGPSGAGKTTAQRAIAASAPGVVAIDGDVIARGAEAVAGEKRDYNRYWSYVISIAEEIAANDVTPLVGCLCRPEQILANDLSSFSRLSLLAFVCDAEVRIERAVQRGGSELAFVRTAIEEHNMINEGLRAYEMPAPHTYDVIDTTDLTFEEVQRAGIRWASERCATGS